MPDLSRILFSTSDMSKLPIKVPMTETYSVGDIFGVQADNGSSLSYPEIRVHVYNPAEIQCQECVEEAEGPQFPQLLWCSTVCSPFNLD